ncbi:uncharacterized protein LOC135291689 isoform X2 [Passer domesticus]|uniref:uncharacterized protein LOC135291689 isoform X2 n=1 Tax=Passer domesticus TaxID=48849 RepID=UPI0030FEBD24
MSANCQVRELNTSFRRGTITRILPGMVTRFASAPRACTNTSLSCWPWNNPLRESWNHRTTEINTRPFDIMNSRHQPWPGSASGQQWLFVSVSRSYIDQYHAKFHQCVCNSQAFWYACALTACEESSCPLLAWHIWDTECHSFLKLFQAFPFYPTSVAVSIHFSQPAFLKGESGIVFLQALKKRRPSRGDSPSLCHWTFWLP